MEAIPDRLNGTLRRISSAGPGLLGGPRALLLQIANPKVAQGVEDHSKFRASPLPRLVATMNLLYAILYGSQAEADKAVENMHRRHSKVQGNLGITGGEDGMYSANDPELKCWVWATLVETTERLYEEFVGPISPEEQVLLYSDWVILGRKLGIPEVNLPPNHIAFHEYMEEAMLSLEVTEVARSQAKFITASESLSKSLPWIVRSASGNYVKRQSKMAMKVAAATLPRWMCEAYGLTVPDPSKYAAFRSGISRALSRSSNREWIPLAYMALLRLSKPLRKGFYMIQSRL